MIVAGSKTQELAARVSFKSGISLAEVEYNRFPDGEQLVRVKDDSDRYLVVASTRSDPDYIELIQLLDACSSSEIELVVPYMGYARQDDAFRDGEPISVRGLARAISDYVERLYTVNVHNPGIHQWFECESIDIDASALIGESYNEMLDDPLVVSPDQGAREMASEAAKSLDSDYTYLEKNRVSGDEVELEPKEFDVENREVLLVDDIISTGGTMTEAASLLSEQGAESIYIGCIHPVFTGNSVLSMYRAGVREIKATDTLSSSHSTITVSGLIADEIY